MNDRNQNLAENAAQDDHDLWDDDPEPKLELIDGQLICSTLEGSRRMLWHILDKFGPDCAIPMAPVEKWFAALTNAFSPKPVPQTIDEWKAWASTSTFKPTIPVAGPRFTWEHYHAWERLWMGFHVWSDHFGMGFSIGRDFVMRLGEQAFEPDVQFLANDRVHQMREYFCDGPATVAVEVLQASNQEQERVIKRREYAAGGVLEYWIVDPFDKLVEFLMLGKDGNYDPAAVSPDGIYRSVTVPGLALRVEKLWAEEVEFYRPAGFFEEPPAELQGTRDYSWQKSEHYDELGWNSLPFAPTPELPPVPIRFDQYIAWTTEAKFEWYAGLPSIGSFDGTHRVLGMLLMTFGLAEAARLIEPARWVQALQNYLNGDYRWLDWRYAADRLYRQKEREYRERKEES
jgi:Uma2 family endonuclease